MAQTFGLTVLTGNGSANNAGATTSIIASPGATKVIRVMKGVVSVTTAAAGGGGLVRICDGTTTIMQWDANAVKGYTFDYGDIGFPLTAGNAFQLIVSGAGVTQATANIMAVAVQA